LVLPAAAQWRTGYFIQREAAGQTAATIPWSKYTHVIQYALQPSYSNGACGLDSKTGQIGAASVTDFVNSAHAARVQAVIGIRQDDTLAAITACTSPDNIGQFVESIKAFVASNGYDGVDLDWEKAIIPNQYQDLVRRLRAALPAAALSASVGIADRFIIAAIQYDLNQINIRAYNLDSQDLNQNAIGYTWYDSPTLQGANSQDQAMDILSDLYQYAGNAPAKLGLTAPFYGRIRQGCLDDTGTAGVTEPNQAWYGSAKVTDIPYRDLVNSTYWTLGTRVWDDSRQSQYIQSGDGTCAGDAFISYVGPQQLRAVVALIKSHKLGGIATYGLSYEFTPSAAGAAQYPLSSAISDAVADKPTALVRSQQPTAARPNAGVLASRSQPPSTPSQTAYYVDSVNGSDSNPGTQASPWKTIAKVNATTLSAGQSVFFLSGDTWREELIVSHGGTATSPVTLGAYGSGASPIITGSNLVTAGFTMYSPNVWEKAVTTQPNIVYFNGNLGTPVASPAKITAQFDWYWSSNILYVWSPANTDPGAYFQSPGIEAGARNRALETNNTSYITINGLTFRDGNTPFDTTVAIGFTTVQGIIFTNCVVERGVATGISTGGNTTSASVTIENSTIRNNGGWGIYVDNQFTSATFSGNIIYGNGWRSVIDSQEYDGIEGALGNANIFGNTVYSNSPVCVSAAYCHGIYADAGSANVNIYQNTVYGNLTGGGIKTRGSATIYQNTLYGNYGEGLQVGGNGSTNIVVQAYDNLVYGNDTCNCMAGILELESGPGSVNLTLENNTVYQNGNTSQQELKINDNLAALTILNNIFFATPTRRTINIIVAQTGAVNINHNLQWRADGNPSIMYNNNAVTWAQWQALGFDVNAPAPANPLFTNPPTSFILESGSPALGTGLFITGVSTSTSANIGAF
jgi:parallel beta-helix repeat protein